MSTLMKRMELISKDEDKVVESNLVKDAFRACNYPEWALKDRSRKSSKKKEEQTSIAKVTTPYHKGLSERIARSMKKHQIDTQTHKHTTTTTTHNNTQQHTTTTTTQQHTTTTQQQQQK